MGHTNKGIEFVETKNDFVRPDNFTAKAALLKGYASDGDGGEGYFIWDPTEPIASDDGGTIFAVDASPGCWKRVYSGAMNVKWFGAKGDDSTNDATAIQAALSGDNRHVFFPRGIYRISSAITLGSNIMITGEPDAEIYRNVDGSGNILTASSKSDIVIQNINFRGSVAVYTDTDTVYGVYFTSCTGVWINKCKFREFYECLLIQQSDDIYLSENYIYNFNNMGLNISRSSNWHVHHNTITDCFGQSQNYCIQATGQSGDQGDCSIIGNHLLNNPSWSAVMIHETNDVRICNNDMRNIRIGIDIGHISSANVMENIVISGNYIEGTDTDYSTGKNCGIYVDGRSDKYFQNVSITGNTIRNFNNFGGPSVVCGGIGLEYINNLTVVGNTIYDVPNTGNSRAAGICIFFTINSATISNNTMEDCYNGIHVYSGSLNDVIFANNVMRNGTRAIWLDSTTSSNSKIVGTEHSCTNGMVYASVGANLQPLTDFKNQSGTITTAISAGTTYTNNITIYGARAGDPMHATINTYYAGLIIHACVSANDTVQYQATNTTASTINLTNEIFTIVPVLSS